MAEVVAGFLFRVIADRAQKVDRGDGVRPIGFGQADSANREWQDSMAQIVWCRPIKTSG
jgi:hypothetical protein